MGTVRGWKLLVLVLGILGLGTIGMNSPPVAQAQVLLCGPGSGAGQCAGSRGIATNVQSGDIYVVDSGNNRVDRFSATGQFELAFGWGVANGNPAAQVCGPDAVPSTSVCQKGIAGAGGGQFSSPTSIAIDNSGGPDQGSIYVGTDSFRVQKFSASGTFLRAWGWDVVATGPGDDPADQFEVCIPELGDICKVGLRGQGSGQFGREEGRIAVGPSGVVYASDKLTLQGGDPPRLQTFSTAGAALDQEDLPNTRRVLALGVDAAGNVYLSYDDGDSALRKQSAAGVEFGPPYPLGVGRFTTAVGVSPGSGEVFVGQGEASKGIGPTYWLVAQYTADGTQLRRFGYGQLGSSLIEDVEPLQSASGDVLVSAGSAGVTYLSFPPPGPIAPAKGLDVDPVSNTKATLNAEVNPEGKATDYHFEYLTEQEFIDQGGFMGPATESTPTESVGVAGGFDLHLVEEEIGCPDPTSEAGLPDSPCLLPETDYRFRFVATNADGGGEGTVEGEFKTRPPFEILAAWASEVGPDSARLSAEVNPLGIPTTGWFEYVDDATFQASGFVNATRIPALGSELDFGDGDNPVIVSASPFPLTAATSYHYRVVMSDPLLSEPVLGEELTFTTFAKVQTQSGCLVNEAFRTGPAAFLPDCRGYEMVSPLDKNNGDIIPRQEGATFAPAALEQSAVSGNRLAYSSYRAFANPASAPLTSQYIAARRTDGWYTHAIVPPRGKLVVTAGETIDTEFKAFSPDLCQAWLRTVADPPLVANAPGGVPNLYRRTDEECGGVRYEAVTPESSLHGSDNGLELQGLSADGTKAIFITPAQLGGDMRLFWNGGGETLPVCVLPGATNCAAGTGSLPGYSRTPSLHNAISADGTQVFWSAAAGGPAPIYLRDTQGTEETADDTTTPVSAAAEALAGTSSSRYWTAADDGSKAIFTSGGRLFAFEVAGEATEQIAAGVIGVLGWSEDAARIYFVSSQVLTAEGENSEGDKAQAGEPNLYLYVEGEGFSFVGTLTSADANPLPIGGQTSPVSVPPFTRTSRVSADGRFAAFVSYARLTGYDNTDAASGKADAEVFRYDAQAEELLCASCNPSGGPPGRRAPKGRGGERGGGAPLPGWQNTLYASRVLSEGGQRLFFESTDALTPRDTNGRQDVYQWEASGAGGCEEGAPTFSESNGGCIELISSGESARDAEFRDASPSGNDVFFATLASLVPQDFGLVDIYDARVGGGFPPPPPPPIICEGETCQHPTPAPAYDPSASATYQGPGNLKAASAKKPPCKKGKVRRKGRCVKKSKPKAGKHAKKNRRAAR